MKSVSPKEDVLGEAEEVVAVVEERGEQEVG